MHIQKTTHYCLRFFVCSLYALWGIELICSLLLFSSFIKLHNHIEMLYLYPLLLVLVIFQFYYNIKRKNGSWMVFFGVGCVIINLFWVSFLSSDFKAIIQFTCWFLLTHPGQRRRRRHSGDSSYWRRPRDGGRQNKEHTQEVHEACTCGTTHLFNTQRIFVFYVFCLIFC